MFRQSIQGTRPLRQDTVFHRPQRRCRLRQAEKRHLHQQADACQYFSDQFQPLLASDDPVRYLRQDISSAELKTLRRGDYPPELFLDLHGLTQQQAKQELAALIVTCRRQHISCACVMHGHGKQILKKQIPLWLAQHPHVLAFHQASKNWGGNAALLVLLELDHHLAGLEFAGQTDR